MPTYEYRCKQCSHTMEEFQSMKDDPLVMCPVCHTPNLVRVIGNGAGLIFKGQGFYLTDYKKGTSEATTSSAASSKQKNGSGDTAEKKPATSPDAESKEQKKSGTKQSPPEAPKSAPKSGSDE